MRIKNWEKFQHFKDRKPPWIKLYRDLLDDKEWHRISGDAKGVLISLWLLASESGNGEVPDIDTISFRLRMPEQKIKTLITSLSHWLDHDDINSISMRRQVDSPETETETETEKTVERKKFDFEFVWKAYPNKDGRKEAERHFHATVKTEADWIEINRALENYVKHLRNETWKKPKNGSTWFNNWRDWVNWKDPNKAITSPSVSQKVQLDPEEIRWRNLTPEQRAVEMKAVKSELKLGIA